MIDERSRRRATFQEGTSIRMADGQNWSLPGLTSDRPDPVLERLLRAVGAPEDGPERLRDELALTILLLSRNYHLSPESYPKILGFRPADPARGELQRTIRELVLGAPQSPPADLVPNVDRRPRPSRRWGLSAASESLSRVRSRWSLRSR
jgi:hypothetical protein